MTDLRELLHEAADAAPDATGLEQRVRDRATGADLFTQLEASFSRRSRLRRLAAALSATPPSTVGLPEPRWRSRLPSARIVVPLVAAAVLAPGVVGGIVDRVRGSEPEVSALGTAADDLRCADGDVGYGDVFPAADLPDAMRLVVTSPGLKQRGAAVARQHRSYCEQLPTVLSLIDRDSAGVVSRRVVLAPLRVPVDPPEPAPPDVPDVVLSTVAVRGVNAQLRDLRFPVSGATSVESVGRNLFWTGVDGQSWGLSTVGMPVEQVVALADALQLHGPNAPATLPADLMVGWTDLGFAPAAPSTTRHWFVEYSGSKGTVVQVSVGDTSHQQRGWTGSRAVTVHGKPGEWQGSGAGSGWFSWDQAPGIAASMFYGPSGGAGMPSGPGLTFENALAIADGLTPAPDSSSVVREAQ